MALARALGFDLCPRLSHLRDRRLHVPVGHTVPEELVSVTDRDVRLEAIELIWDDFVHLTASVQSGHCSAVQALMRFGSAARGQPLYDGGVCLGQLLRSIFLIDFFTIQAFRGEMQHALNRGEAVHVVERAIHQGKIPVELTKHRHSLMAVSSAVTLLTNAVMAWNTITRKRKTMDISRSLENTGICSQQDVHLVSRKSGQYDRRNVHLSRQVSHGWKPEKVGLPTTLARATHRASSSYEHPGCACA
jgi:TnpA family transposase